MNMKRYIKFFCALLPVVLLCSLMLPLSASADYPLQITKNLPTAYTVQANQQVTLSVEASGGNGTLAFQWYSSRGPLGWTDNSITFTVSTSDTIWCIVSSGSQYAVTNTCSLNVVSSPTPSAAPKPSGYLNPNAPVTAPKISKQPSSVAVPLGQPGGTLSVVATNEWLNAGVELKYQWYTCPINNMQYATPINGATSASYTVPAGYQEGKVYFVVSVSTYNGQNTSEPVFSNVVYAKYGAASILEVTKSPTGEKVDEGGKATFIAHADGATSHQWRFLPQGYPSERFLTAQNLGATFPGVNVIGADSDTLVLANIPAAMDGMKVFCVYYENPRSFVITNSATLSVKAKSVTTYTPGVSQNGTTQTGTTQTGGTSQPGTAQGTTYIPGSAVIVTPTITVQPEGAVLEEGKSTTLSVGVSGDSAGGAQIKYQWYRNDKNSNANGTAINGAQSAEYTPETIPGSKYYYVGVWASDGTKNSKVVYSSPVAVTYTAAVATPSPTPVPVTPQPGRSSGQKSLLSQLALPIIAMLVAIAVAIAAVIMLKKSNKRDEMEFRGRDYGSKYDDYEDE